MKMELYEAIHKRRTTRDFTGEPIRSEVIRRIIEAGMMAPTNDHMRDWKFMVIDDKAVVRLLLQSIPAEMSREQTDAILNEWHMHDLCQKNMYRDAIPKQHRMLIDASCVILPLFRQNAEDLLHPQNLSHLNGFASIWCCIENMFLAATAEGLSCALRIPLGDEAQHARQLLGFPKEYAMPCFIGVGVPATGCKPPVQKEIDVDALIHKNQW